MLIALPGVFVGVFIYSMTLSDASTSSRFGYAIVSCIFIALGGALSLPVYMRIPEKRKDDTLEKSSTWELIKEIFCTDASRIIVLKNLFDGGTGGAVAIFSYYLSYVAKVTLDERSAYVIVILIGALFVFALIAFTMKKLFDLKDKEVMLTRYRTLQMTAVGATLFRATAFAIGLSISKSGIVFVILIVINQGLQAITDFWAALSVTLVIDEANVRKRKIDGPDAPSVEGRYLGVLNTCYSMGVAISSSALLLGLGQSGLDVRDCVEFEDDETLREQCYEADQAQQPYGARMYIRVVFFAIAPILLVCMGLSISQFPIWGERLRKLELEKSAQESTYNVSPFSLNTT